MKWVLVVEVGWSGRAEQSLGYLLDIRVDKEETVGYTNPEFMGEAWARAMKVGVKGKINQKAG